MTLTEARRADEVNRLKSEFVRLVAHELRFGSIGSC
jgi:signal transduction histidine kinase